MITDLQNLLILQSLDDQIATVQKELQKIPVKIQAFNEKKQGKKEEYDTAVKDLDAQHSLQRKLEADLKDNENKLIKLNVQLNQLKSNEDYRAMLKQIDTIKFRNGEIENAILETLEEIDTGKVMVKRLKKEVEAFTSEIDAAIQKTEQEKQSLESKLQEMQREREEVLQSLDDKLLKRYQKLLTLRVKPVIARISGESCEGCHLNIRPNVIIEIKRDEKLHECENCGRFIYWEEKKEPQKSEQAK